MMDEEGRPRLVAEGGPGPRPTALAGVDEPNPNATMAFYDRFYTTNPDPAIRQYLSGTGQRVLTVLHEIMHMTGGMPPHPEGEAGREHSAAFDRVILAACFGISIAADGSPTFPPAGTAAEAMDLAAAPDIAAVDPEAVDILSDGSGGGQGHRDLSAPEDIGGPVPPPEPDPDRPCTQRQC